MAFLRGGLMVSTLSTECGREGCAMCRAEVSEMQWSERIEGGWKEQSRCSRERPSAVYQR